MNEVLSGSFRHVKVLVLVQDIVALLPLVSSHVRVFFVFLNFVCFGFFLDWDMDLGNSTSFLD